MRPPSNAHDIAFAEATKSRAGRFRRLDGAHLSNIPIVGGEGARGSSLTAAAEIISTNRNKDLVSKRKRPASQAWQDEAWQLRDETGELRFLGDRQARAASQVRLFIAHRAIGSNAEPEPVEDGPVAGLNESLFGDSASVSQVLRRAAQQLIFSGESFQVVSELEGGVFDWQVYSNAEVTGGQNGSAVKLTDGMNPRTLDPQTEILTRAWTPHPRLQSAADAPIRALLPIARELRALTQYVGAQIDSRLAGAGLLLLPEGIQSAFTKPGESNHNIANEMIDYFIRPLSDPGTAASVVPYIAIVPGDLVDKIKHLTFASVLDPKAHELRDEAIRRIGLGMDSDPSILLGAGTTSHWSSFSIGEDEVRLGVAPTVDVICHALTVGFVRPLVASGNVNPQEYVVARDTTPLELRPDRSQDAIALFDKGEISLEALLRETGFSTTDAPKDDERHAMILQRLLFAAPMSPLAGQILDRMGIKLTPLPGGPIVVQGPQDQPGAGDHGTTPDGPPEAPTVPPAGATDTSADDPARKPVALAAAGSPADDDHSADGMIALLPTVEDAERLAVGDVSVDELHLTLAYLPEVGDYDAPDELAALWPAAGPIVGEVNGTGILGGGSAAVWLINAPGLTDARNGMVDAIDGTDGTVPAVSHDFDGFIAHITAGSADTTLPPEAFGPITFDRLRVSLRGEHTDYPLTAVAGDNPDKPSTPNVTPPEEGPTE